MNKLINITRTFPFKIRQYTYKSRNILVKNYDKYGSNCCDIIFSMIFGFAFIYGTGLTYISKRRNEKYTR